MKKWMIIIGLLLFLFIGGYLAVFKLILPKTATAFIPAKWQKIPLGQKRIVVHEYLGTPVRTKGNTDYWESRVTDNKNYILIIGYDQDTIAVNFTINYQVEVLGILNKTVISNKSL